MAIRLRDQASADASLAERSPEALRCVLTAAIGVGIKSQIDGSRTIAQLPKLVRVEMTAHGAGDVLKAGLP